MDPLSELVDLLDLRGRMDLRCLLGHDWSVPHDPIGPWHAPFHILLRGHCELWLPQSRSLIPLAPGSLVILPRGSAHVLRTPAHSPSKESAIKLRTGELLPLKTNLRRPDRADTDILCGEFEFGGRRRSILLDALPEALVIAFDQRPEFVWLEGLVGLMAHEIEQRGPGASAVVADLSGTLFTLAVRAYLETRPELGGVLGLMASPRLSPALQAMLDEPQEPWTVATLAQRCHLSRASFAREFQQRAGCGPLELLTTLRMELASRLLAQGRQDTATVGEAVGYRSEAAFNRAFARHAGVTPGRFRRAAAGRKSSAV